MFAVRTALGFTYMSCDVSITPAWLPTVWRFHPKTHRFEVFAEGTSNPWGLDFNDYGHAFTTACVIEHLYQPILGARYKRQAGRHFNPNVYDDIRTIADHVHWVGNRGPHAGNSRSDAAGGGHAHAGAMIYLGGDNWPKEYRDAIAETGEPLQRGLPRAHRRNRGHDHCSVDRNIIVDSRCA